MAGLPPNFRLNLTAIQKNVNKQDDEEKAKQPAPQLLNQDLKKGATVQTRPRPAVQGGSRQSTTLARKNLVIQESDSDSDLDLDLESVPVGKEVPEAPPEQPPDVVEAPMIQVSHLPELDVDDDDDFAGQNEGNKLAILQDLLLTQDQADEPPEEWSYRTFIKQFANSEASQENAGDGEDDDYDLEEESDDGYEQDE